MPTTALMTRRYTERAGSGVERVRERVGVGVVGDGGNPEVGAPADGSAVRTDQRRPQCVRNSGTAAPGRWRRPAAWAGATLLEPPKSRTTSQTRPSKRRISVQGCQPLRRVVT